MTDRKGERGEKGDHGDTGARGRHGNDTNNPAVWALAFVVVLCFSLLAIGLHRDSQAASAANRALCSLKSDDQDSLKSTKRILAANPTGPVFLAGVKFSHKEIVSDEQKLEKHIAAYKDVSCG